MLITTRIDWNSAFPRQCPQLGIESFMRNDVRNSLIPVLTNYFQNRKMSVKWHGHITKPITINGGSGGPQGATLEKYEVIRCKTERRLKNSPIVYMQNLLNTCE